MKHNKMSPHQSTGGMANWSIHHPIAVIMLSLTVIVIGLFSFDRLKVNLLPDLIYPEVRVRIMEPGTPAQIMEDRFTRQLEEQLAITEGATRVQSNTSEGRSSVDLSFPYGTDINQALQDASNRLDRAKRFLPDTEDPPVIYKRDPSQIAVMELVVSSKTRNPVELRSWVDYTFSKWFLNIDGVASTEVGGGLIREIQVIIDQEKLAANGFKISDIKNLLRSENQDIAGGVLYMDTRKMSTRTQARFQSVTEIASLPLINPDQPGIDNTVRLRDVAQILDTHQDEDLRIRLNGNPGVKLSIQKQPDANTISVTDAVHKQIEWFKSQKLLPADIMVEVVSDQSVYVSHALKNASYAALTGALLAMLVVYIFLRDIRRTLIISTAIPLAIFITFLIMDLGHLSLNIMSLGGLALGIGLLVDNTIVMLENISRHQAEDNLDTNKTKSDKFSAAQQAVSEVTGAITAATSTNLVAVLPFLFIGGLIGLLFSELIITLSAAIMASLIVAVTLVPALGAKIEHRQPEQQHTLFNKIQKQYSHILERSFQYKGLILIIFILLLAFSAYQIWHAKQTFFPTMDEGQVNINLTAEPGTRLVEFDQHLQQVEQLILEQAEVHSVFVSSGGFVFGRSQFQSSNRGNITVQLKPMSQRGGISSKDWSRNITKKIKQLNLTGYKIRSRIQGVRGIRLGHGDDDFSLRIQGPDLKQLNDIADQIIERIEDFSELKNLTHNYEEQSTELIINIRRERATDLGVSANEIGEALQLALNGQIATEYIEGDREYDIRIRMQRDRINNINDIRNIIITLKDQKSIRLLDVADITISPEPSVIKRDNQLRINEISASLDDDTDYAALMQKVMQQVNELSIPDGYIVYDGGALDSLKQGEQMGNLLLILAIFLVFVVMTVQYESLLNPLVIIAGVPFSLIGIYIALELYLGSQLSMPARLGMIMLAGIVVNNSIVLVEQIEICRRQGVDILSAILQAASLRLRPILMTTLTSVFGMLPLAAGFNEGSEMLKPMASIIVFGLSFSLLVSLLIIPILYSLIHRQETSHERMV